MVNFSVLSLFFGVGTTSRSSIFIISIRCAMLLSLAFWRLFFLKLHQAIFARNTFIGGRVLRRTWMMLGFQEISPLAHLTSVLPPPRFSSCVLADKTLSIDRQRRTRWEHILFAEALCQNSAQGSETYLHSAQNSNCEALQGRPKCLNRTKFRGKRQASGCSWGTRHLREW